jgi:hypothetical protein
MNEVVTVNRYMIPDVYIVMHVITTTSLLTLSVSLSLSRVWAISVE